MAAPRTCKRRSWHFASCWAAVASLCAGLRNSRDLGRDGFAAAVEAARDADVVLLFLGEEQILSGEARSRAFLNLPGAQEALVDTLSATGKPLVTVIMAGRPLTFHDVAAKSGRCSMPGTRAPWADRRSRISCWGAPRLGQASHHLSAHGGQVPIYYAHLNTGRPASESELGVPMGNPEKPAGYTSKYIDVDFTPEYAFGFGLTYTTWEYSNLRLHRRC